MSVSRDKTRLSERTMCHLIKQAKTKTLAARGTEIIEKPSLSVILLMQATQLR